MISFFTYTSKFSYEVEIIRNNDFRKKVFRILIIKKFKKVMQK